MLFGQSVEMCDVGGEGSGTEGRVVVREAEGRRPGREQGKAFWLDKG